MNGTGFNDPCQIVGDHLRRLDDFFNFFDRILCQGNGIFAGGPFNGRPGKIIVNRENDQSQNEAGKKDAAYNFKGKAIFLHVCFSV